MDHESRMAAVREVLDGLSVGDALGSYLGEGYVRNPQALLHRQIPSPGPDGPYAWTDDSAMAIEIAGVLQRCGTVDEDLLAAAFAARYLKEPRRGYGGTARRILTAIGQGQPWRQVSREVFDGTGSMGNGSAMRVAPIGAYFADDPSRIVDEARRSALPTHWNDDAQAGAIAVALAVGWGFRMRQSMGQNMGQSMGQSALDPRQLFDHVLSQTPQSPVRDGIQTASRLDLTLPIDRAVRVLGNGSDVLCRDTVPFVIYSAARALDSFERAFFETASGQGDIDTTCAMVGAIVAAAGGSPPTAWLHMREPLARPIALDL